MSAITFAPDHPPINVAEHIGLAVSAAGPVCRGCDAHQRADVIQDAVLALLLAAPRHSPAKGAWGTFAFSVARNAAIQSVTKLPRAGARRGGRRRPPRPARALSTLI